MKPCSDIFATDLAGLACEVHSRTGVQNCGIGTVKVVLRGEEGVNVFAYEHRIDGPIRWKAIFTAETPALVVMECIKGATTGFASE